MSHTTVTYKSDAQQRIDMRWLSELSAKSNSTNQIEKHSLLVGSEQVNVGDLFAISGKVPNEKRN